MRNSNDKCFILKTMRCMKWAINFAVLVYTNDLWFNQMLVIIEPIDCVDMSHVVVLWLALVYLRSVVSEASRKGISTVYPKKYAHGFCFAVLCCGYILTDFPISTRLTLLALWQSNDCPSASKATLMNMDKYFMWSHYERLHNNNKATHNKTVCIFLGIYCNYIPRTFFISSIKVQVDLLALGLYTIFPNSSIPAVYSQWKWYIYTSLKLLPGRINHTLISIYYRVGCPCW